MDVTRAILPHFRSHKSGLIVNVSLGGGMFTLPMISLYCASKFALEGFSESLSYELASQGIAVKLVEPHGGVSSTTFNETSARNYATDPSLSDYDDFARRTAEAFARMSAARLINARSMGPPRTAPTSFLVGNDTRGFPKA
jgi:short-subunit dehydrogenase